VNFLEAFQPVCYKVPSASLTDSALLKYLRRTGLPVILSTGMSTMEQIKKAVNILGKRIWSSPMPPALIHATPKN